MTVIQDAACSVSPWKSYVRAAYDSDTSEKPVVEQVRSFDKTEKFITNTIMRLDINVKKYISYLKVFTTIK